MTITPTQPPVLPDSVYPVGRPPVLVTGADGWLGCAVLHELAASGVRAVAYSRTPSSAPAHRHVVGDIATGAGLDDALREARSVIHCANDPRDPVRVDVQGTQNLSEALRAWAPEAHVVFPSVIGCWESPLAFYRAKADAENALLGWGGMVSIVRSTLVHPLVRRLVSGRAAYLTGATTSISIAPTDPAWLASRLVDVALVHRPLVVPAELAGPETLTIADFATLTAHLEGRRPRRFLALPHSHGALRAFADGVNLPGPEVQRGGRSYAAWLGDQPR